MAVSTDSAESADRVYVNVPMSQAFKDAFEKWCDEHAYKVMARAGQLAIATLIGYDLKNEPEPKAKSKYGKDEAGEVDRQTAKFTNSFKGAEQTRLLRAQLKAKVKKDTAEVARLDDELTDLLSDDWAPTPAKAIELRSKAVETLIKEKKIPADYEDETLADLRATAAESAAQESAE